MLGLIFGRMAGLTILEPVLTLARFLLPFPLPKSPGVDAPAGEFSADIMGLDAAD